MGRSRRARSPPPYAGRAGGHTVACEMVSAGVPLVEIAEVLRHHRLQTTAVYVRVDLDRLRLLAAPSPGGEGR